MGTLNYTSSIPATRSAQAMSTLLAKHGASSVTVEFAGENATGLSFRLPTPHGPRDFSLPIDVDAVQTLLVKQRSTERKKRTSTDRAQAERTAWKVAHDWLAAQLAIVEAQMAKLDEVMLPYLVVEQDARKTLYAAYREHEESLALTTGAEVS